jgi:ABC-2 type transport system ATP-binding protein
MSGPAEPVVELRDLRREFVVRSSSGGLRRTKRTVAAVDGITATVTAGEACRYIGANGAGKSTTIKMLTGILVPTSGTVRTCGFDPVPSRRELAREIGVVFAQRSQLWWDLPLGESFAILAAIHGLSAQAARARIDQLVEGLELGPLLATPVRQLSLGERMLQFLVAERRAEGTTLLLTTHDMSDIDRSATASWWSISAGWSTTGR